MSYESNLAYIRAARIASENPAERDVAFTLQKIIDRNSHRGVEDCIVGFAKWARHKWSGGGMELPQDLTRYTSTLANQSCNPDMFKAWISAQESIAKEVHV